MKTLIGRFASPEDATQAQALLATYRPNGNVRGSLGNRVSWATTLSVIVGAFVGFLAANGTVNSWGLTLDGGKSYLGMTTSDPALLFGYTVLGFALGIPAGLFLGVIAASLPARGTLPFRVIALTHYGQTVIVQTGNRYVAQVAKLLSEGQAQHVQTLSGRIEPEQVSSALDQLSRQF